MDAVGPYIQPCFFRSCQLLDNDFAPRLGTTLSINIRILIGNSIMAPRTQRTELAVDGVILTWIQQGIANTLLAMSLILAPGRTASRSEAETPTEGLRPLPIAEVHPVHRQWGHEAGSRGRTAG